MIVISSGMQKSGSAYFYSVINELLAASPRGADARAVKAKHGLEDLMRDHNNNVGELSFKTLFTLWRVSRREGVMVVKTHKPPTRASRWFTRLGLTRTVYSYRDPRDAMLSAMDHGQKIRDRGDEHSFAKLETFEDALKVAKRWVRTWEAYRQAPGVLTVRFEDMMQDPKPVAQDIIAFLGLPIDPEQRDAILWKFSKDNESGDRAGMHFNQPKVARHKAEMTDEQQAKCAKVFRKCLGPMGYEID